MNEMHKRDTDAFDLEVGLTYSFVSYLILTTCENCVLPQHKKRLWLY